jgi:hypothetical protein
MKLLDLLIKFKGAYNKFKGSIMILIDSLMQLIRSFVSISINKLMFHWKMISIVDCYINKNAKEHLKFISHLTFFPATLQRKLLSNIKITDLNLNEQNRCKNGQGL